MQPHEISLISLFHKKATNIVVFQLLYNVHVHVHNIAVCSARTKI